MDILFDKIVDILDMGVVVLDRELKVVLWNRWMAENSRFPQEEVKGRKIMEIFPGLEEKGFRWKAENVFKIGTFAFFSQKLHQYLFPFPLTSHLLTDFEYMQQNITIAPIHNNEGKVELICLSLIDNTDSVMYRKRLEESTRQLKEMSRTDYLTGLPNRRHLIENLQNELSRHKRQNLPFSISILDVDFFKQFNDTHGHLCGDQILIQLGQLFKQSLRRYDFIGRYGGEEFSSILPNTDGKTAFDVMERLRKTTESHVFTYNEKELKVTISVGIAHADKTKLESLNSDILLKRADEALYQAKEQGRNQSVLHSGD
ncbi:diguanylate cyclase [Thermodesulfobacteriota bacterium]